MASPNTNDSFLQWDPAQVCNYINSLNLGDRPNLGDCFLDNNIEGSLLPFITTEHLKEIGITKLSTRLQIKKATSELIANHCHKHPPSSLDDPEYRFNNLNINNNCIGLESLTLATVLMKDMLIKLNETYRENRSSMPSPVSPGTQLDMKRLNENFNKLKTDMIPIIRLVKESKPLPTPTLDPGSAPIESPSASSFTEQLGPSVSQQSQQPALVRSDSVNTTVTKRNSGLTSPNHPNFNRFSSGSLLSMGTGKVVQHSVAKPVMQDRSQPDFTLLRANSSFSNRNKPKIVESRSTSSVNTATTAKPPPLKQHSSSLGSVNTTSTANASVSASNEPLKQLRASSEDSCLKILQQAMKRHHIPRDDWLKYVLVICYGDKERILKLAEKPVIIFKELQELGKHPAIMLRQLAATAADDNDSELYEDSRIGDDVPGGTL
ncbi:uncharacterized protein AC631_04889 [Debaryomyces fabryi]|uniref:SAM domain-containing protein n=1 Tax=Debaryomyces fabryi TaxID=58627 RepID=A0A0V1PT58_9ASCO|nr:uncharacterized protein AC631_04889 [Debaryomyces fabryi]KRZ99343.1 hypothetical protein AC631_04889 [Debaryomyces fabryi]CUM47949.1 unnamed protein product [Debaryomyces fabryi]